MKRHTYGNACWLVFFLCCWLLLLLYSRITIQRSACRGWATTTGYGAARRPLYKLDARLIETRVRDVFARGCERAREESRDVGLPQTHTRISCARWSWPISRACVCVCARFFFFFFLWCSCFRIMRHGWSREGENDTWGRVGLFFFFSLRNWSAYSAGVLWVWALRPFLCFLMRGEKLGVYVWCQLLGRDEDRHGVAKYLYMGTCSSIFVIYVLEYLCTCARCKWRF